MIRKLLVLLCLFVPATAHAEWYEATSPNFVVYSEGRPQDATDFAAKLERYHYVLRTFHHITAPPSTNRLRVFLFSNASKVGRLNSGAAGYYVPDARGLMLVGTSSHSSNSSSDLRSARGSGEAALDPEYVLLHEYAHHFMYQYFPATYPTWYSEGFAEFWGATQFQPNDVVDVGAPAEHRFVTFQMLGWLPLQRLLTAHGYGEVQGYNVYLLYAEGWLLMRYVFDHPERKRQLDTYLRLINSGRAYEQAMHEAFPDIARFDSELFNYAGRGRFDVVRLPFRTIDVGEIATRALRPAENALIESEIRISQGYPRREAADRASEVRSIAARYPDDPFALQVLMDAERLAGNNDAAVAAADRLLRIQPENARALMTKGLVQVAALRAAGSSDQAAWNAARQLLARAARAAPDDPVALEAFYNGYALQGMLPPVDAQNALYTAMELAPSDDELRYELAHDFEQRSMIREAIAIIKPVAQAMPHRDGESEGERRRREEREERNRQAGREHHESPREMLARLEARLGQSGQQAAAQTPAPATQR
jgi:tetratricopeptide (TPR) repeat protein